LLSILDREIRLITPCDSGSHDDSDRGRAAPLISDTRLYQLTHDYLVPTLRNWLTRNQQQTWRGRAELRLVDRTAIWNAKPENRHLLSLWEYLNVHLLTDKRLWTAPQRTMMASAARYHGIRSGIAVLLLVAATLGAFSIWNHNQV